MLHVRYKNKNNIDKSEDSIGNNIGSDQYSYRIDSYPNCPWRNGLQTTYRLPHPPPPPPHCRGCSVGPATEGGRERKGRVRRGGVREGRVRRGVRERICERGMRWMENENKVRGDCVVVFIRYVERVHLVGILGGWGSTINWLVDHKVSWKMKCQIIIR